MITGKIKIRLFQKSDWDQVWHIIEPVFRAGETYAFPREISETDAHKAWIETPAHTYVVEDQENGILGTRILGPRILGTYYLKPNQAGSGAHVCNCGYIVAESARGMGIASEMCRHSQAEALSKGYKAMQYNLVVSTNESAVRLWKKLGFEIVGTLPKAFQHPRLGLVDAYVMYKLL